MPRSATLLVALLLIASACSSGEPGTDAAPRSPAAAVPEQLPAAYANRLRAACERSFRLDRRAETSGEDRSRAAFRSATVIRRALHTGEVPAQAGTMVAAFDEYFSGLRRALAILKRTDRLEPIMKEALGSGDHERFLQVRDEFAAALDEAEAAFSDAAVDYERFITELRRFELEECDRTQAS